MPAPTPSESWRLAVILFDSGFNTSFRSVRAALGPALALASVDVILTAGLVGAAAHYLLDPFLAASSCCWGQSSARPTRPPFSSPLRVRGITVRDRCAGRWKWSRIEHADGDLLDDHHGRDHRLRRGHRDGRFDILTSFAQQLSLALAGLGGGQLIMLVVNRLEVGGRCFIRSSSSAWRYACSRRRAWSAAVASWPSTSPD